MFWRGKSEKEKKANERLAKRLLGKDSGRPTFGFKCSSSIQASIKKLAGDLNVPIFSLSEHALELGMIQVNEAMKDPEYSKFLDKVDMLPNFFNAKETGTNIKLEYQAYGKLMQAIGLKAEGK